VISEDNNLANMVDMARVVANNKECLRDAGPKALAAPPPSTQHRRICSFPLSPLLFTVHPAPVVIEPILYSDNGGLRVCPLNQYVGSDSGAYPPLSLCRPWLLTIIRSEGTHALRPERGWRPIVTVDVDHHPQHEVQLGSDGQNPNLKLPFRL
jgi:hypothetical protein